MKLSPSETAVVTGAGSGIGRALARALAQRGCKLALADLREDRLRELEQELGGTPSAVSIHPVDVADAAAVSELARSVRARHGRASVLVNCAGISHSGSFAEARPEDFERVVAVNFGGTVHGCRAFLPQLREGTGHIVNLASCFALLGFPDKSAYSASKFAVRGFTEALRAELRATRVGVTLVYPGPVDTNLARDGRDDDPLAKEREIRFLAKRAVPVERTVRAILRGIERDAARVLVGADYRLIDWGVRLAPAWVQALSARSRGVPR